MFDPTRCLYTHKVAMVVVPACLSSHLNRWEPLVKVLTGKIFRWRATNSQVATPTPRSLSHSWGWTHGV